MAKNGKKNKNVVFIVIGIVALFMFGGDLKVLPSDPASVERGVHKIDISTSDTPINIELKVRENLDVFAVVEGIVIPDASGTFYVTLTNSKGIPVQNVEFIQQYDDSVACETANTDEFEDPTMALDSTAHANYWVDAAEINHTTTYPDPAAETGLFDLECYALSDPGTTTFTFEFVYDYIDPEGQTQSNIPIVANAYVEIRGDTCAGGVPVGDCAATGELCTFESGVGPILQMDQVCCFQVGGAWSGGTCVFGCGGGDLGTCKPNPGGYDTNTYCNPYTAQWEEDCGYCPCFDYYGNENTGCDGHQCIFSPYGGDVNVNVQGSHTDVTYCSQCDSWTEQGCGNATCAEDEMYNTRSCDPVGCVPTDGFGEFECFFDPVNCGGCQCGPWSDDACGNDISCPGYTMEQSRTCTPPACDIESQCVGGYPACIGMFEGLTTGSTSYATCIGDDWSGQIFELDVGATVTQVQLEVSRSFGMHSAEVAITHAQFGLPYGADIVSVTVPAGLLPMNKAFHTFVLTPTPLSPGEYAVVLRSTGIQSWEHIRSYYNKGMNLYLDGTRVFTKDGGAQWRTMPNDDLTFMIEGYQTNP